MGKRLNFEKYLEEPLRLFEKCKESFIGGLGGRDYDEMVFETFYKRLSGEYGRQGGKCEYLFPVFFQDAKSIGTKSKGDFLYKEMRFDVKGNESTSFDLIPLKGIDTAERLSRWREQLKLKPDSDLTKIVFKQIMNLGNNKNFDAFIFVDKNREYSKILYMKDLLKVKRSERKQKEMLSQFSLRDKGGDSRGLSMSFRPESDK